MKKRILFSIVLVFCCAATVLAQQNNPISYQAVVRDASNHLVTATPLSVAVKLTDNNNGFYEERHYVTSNNNGMISLWVGNGEDQSGNWNSLKWDKVTAEMKIYRRSDGELIVTHTTPISAVPYALYAETVNMDTIINYIEEHPFEQKNADWEATSGVQEILHKPTIPVVNDGYLNIVIDGDTTKFTANQAVNTIVDIPNPTIPEVNDGHLNIVISGDTTTFTANQAVNTTVNIDTIIKKLEESISALEERISSLEEENSALEERVYVLENASDTSFACGLSKMRDRDGHLYETVQINAQCWTKTNMRTTKTANGANLTKGTVPGYIYKVVDRIKYDTIYNSKCDTLESLPHTVTCDTNAYAVIDYDQTHRTLIFRDTIRKHKTDTIYRVEIDTIYNIYSLDTASKYYVLCDTLTHDSLAYYDGLFYYESDTNYLYNWEAAKQLCPTGWHVPTTTEWQALTNYVKGVDAYICSDRLDNIAKALASSSGWTARTDSTYPCEVGYDQSANNATGFSAYPAGKVILTGLTAVGQEAVIWLDKADGSGKGDCASLKYDYEKVEVSDDPDQHFGFAVRCIRN